jgi:hypothetical protein
MRLETRVKKKTRTMKNAIRITSLEPGKDLPDINGEIHLRLRISSIISSPWVDQVVGLQF